MATVSEQSPTPTLSLFSLPSKPNHEPPGMVTPPIQTLASVPFKWEEAPGKPRPSDDDDTISMTLQPKPKPARCLELPPRLLNEAAKVSNLPSPTTVLDGPYVGRSRSLSFGKGRSVSGSEKVVFGSTRWWWGNSKKNNKEVVVGVGFDFSSNDDVDNGIGDSGGDSGGATKVKITRIRRRSSFFNFSGRRSHLLTSIYDSFKQVVPWKRRQAGAGQIDRD